MPFYHAIVAAGSLPEEQRQAFANDVVRIHCDITGAPPSFVHVLVTESDRLPDGCSGRISGTIRAGRTGEQKADLAAQLGAALAARAEADPSSIVTTTSDVEASYPMEGGALLPEPGSPEEEAWKLIGSDESR